MKARDSLRPWLKADATHGKVAMAAAILVVGGVIALANIFSLRRHRSARRY